MIRRAVYALILFVLSTCGGPWPARGAMNQILEESGDHVFPDVITFGSPAAYDCTTLVNGKVGSKAVPNGSEAGCKNCLPGSDPAVCGTDGFGHTGCLVEREDGRWKCIAGEPCLAVGQACTVGTQCCSGFCINSVCAASCVALGGTCTTGADCCSGICHDSICVACDTCAPCVTDADCNDHTTCTVDVCTDGVCSHTLMITSCPVGQVAIGFDPNTCALVCEATCTTSTVTTTSTTTTTIG